MTKKLTPLLVIGIASVLIGCSNTGTSSISQEKGSSMTTSKASSSKEENVLVSSLSLNYESYSLAIKKLVTLKPIFGPENATNKTLKWTSSSTEIASVDNRGQCYGWKAGTATITAATTDGSNLSASCEITVYEVEPTSVTLSEHTKELYPGDSFTLNASVVPNDATNKKVTYTSSNLDVAKVSNLGLVEALGVGSATVEVKTGNGLVDHCEITVKSVPVRGFTLKKKDVSLHVGDTYKLTPIFTPTNATDKRVSYSIESSNNEVAVSEDGTIKANKIGHAKVSAKSLDGNIESVCDVTILPDNELVKTPITKTMQDYSYNNLFGLGATPTLNKSKVIVVPVWLSDSTNYISLDKKSEIRDNIEKAFFGTSEDTGWESVSSYYSKASFGKYQFDGIVTDWFDCGLSTNYVGSNESRTTTLTSSAINFVKNKLGDNSLQDYDQDGDGFLDGLIMIYAAPDYSQANRQLGNLWAYTSWVTSNKKNLQDPTVNVFHWASYDFLFSPGEDALKATGKSAYGTGDTSNCYIDAHTFIHETGHMLGLNDYYDYSGQFIPAGGFSMQDYNVGGHDPYSIMALGWTDPYIPTESTTITIKPFQDSGDIVLLTPEFNNCNSPFDEYLLLEYYTPTGLNRFDTYNAYSGSYPTGLDKPGIRLWHVDARLVYGSSYRDVKYSKQTNDPTTEEGKVYMMMTNTYYYTGIESISILGKDYSHYNELQLIRNDKSETYKPKNDISPSSLFYKGDSFDMKTYYKQFYNGASLNNEKPLGWSFNVMNIDENGATIQFSKQK